MQPPTKRRKIDSPAATAPPNPEFASRPDASRKEIPESPQDNPGAAQDGPSLKPMPFTQRPRFAPFLTEDVEQVNVKTPTQTKFTQRPRFSSSLLDLEEQRIIQSAKTTPKLETRSKRPWSPSFVAQPETGPGTQSKNRSSTRKYSQLIGMALHSAGDNCLNTEQIYKWIIDNVPGYDLEDVTWRDGIWVTLTVVEDFVRRDGNLEGPWTFRDGASTEYSPQNHVLPLESIADSSSKLGSGNDAQIKQGGDVFAPLGTDHDLEISDFKPSWKPLSQASTNHLIRSGSETNSALPSTIEETIDIIDLTMDEDEPLPPVARSRSSQKPSAARSIISLLHDTPEEVVENKERSTFLGSRESTWGRTTSVTSVRKSLTPFTDRIVENASRETIESLPGTEKWEVARRHISNLLGSPPKATTSTDAETTNLESPPKLPISSILVSPQPLESTVAPTRQSPVHDLHLKEKSVEPEMSDTHIPLQSVETRQSVPVQPTVEDHSLKESAPMTNDQVMPMDIDTPRESLEPNSTNSFIVKSAQAPDQMVNDVEPRPAPNLVESFVQEQPLDEPPSQQRLPLVEQIQQEPMHEEPPAEESRAEEQLIRESLMKTYTNSAAQTDSPAASSFALGTITQISLEPQAPIEVVLHAVRETVDSTTQTENLPELQAAPIPQPPLPLVQSTTAQGETTKSSKQKTEKDKRPLTQARMDKQALKLLDSFLYPTKNNWSSEILKNRDLFWPEHFETPPNLNPDPLTFDHETKMEEIRARPTRKQIFGKVALSRVAGNDALTRLNEVKLGKQRIDEVNIYKGYTEEEIEEEKRLNEQEGYYNTVEELLGLPEKVVPQIYEQQLAFRDYAPNKSGRIGRAKHIYKIGPNAR
ncbi:hypothetical protein E4T50_07369 [Aureobasidium sp. EXF-12298]|nr:hypothetical protein E4T50_07369 [Aureobasidium sp. EXF-12298]KAI4755109.1 hypothetical protein E4T51_11798 [Aureobasidium sp. EXF-12344]KAI4779643.1 hypothetical protein E4T52_05466 [Aureobasidium sp. EXF-3400]